LQIELVLLDVIRLVKRIWRQEGGRRFGVVQRGKGGLGELVFVDGIRDGLRSALLFITGTFWLNVI
jgi:hypothetical protein